MKRAFQSLSFATAMCALLSAHAASVKFDGNNDYLIMNPPLAFPELTVEFWMRGDVPVKNFTTVLSYAVAGAGNDNHFYIDIRDNRQTIGARVAGTTAQILVPANTADNNWHHVAMTWRSLDGEFELYLDGTLLISTNGMWQGLMPTANGLLVIGQDQDSLGGGFDPSQAYGGRLDDLRIWSVYKTQGEIQALMQKRLTGTETNLQAYYPFEERGNNLFIDHSGHTFRAIGVGVVSDFADEGTDTPIPFAPTVASVSATGAVVNASIKSSTGPATNHFEFGAGSDALQFDTTDEVFMQQAPNLANKSFSIEFWSKRPASATVMYPFSLGTSGTRTLLHCGYASGDDIKFGFFSDDLVIQADIDDSDWHHWAFTFDTNTLTRRIYLDGIQVGQGTAGGMFAGTGPLRLGRYIASNADVNYEGSLDEVRIWQDVALDAATIREWKDKELNGTHPDFANLAGYWPFNEPSQSKVVLDASGNGFDGVYVQNPVRVKGARPLFTQATSPQPLTSTNYALHMDGVDDYVDVPDGVWFNGTDNFTIEARVFVRSYANYSRIIDFGNGSLNNVVLAITSATGGLPYLAVIRSGVNQGLGSPVSIPLNEWAHVAVTWNSGTARLYINGVQVASGAVHAPDNINRTGNYIGRSNFGGNANSDAVFDFVRIWNVARSAEEIGQFQNANVSPSASGLMLNYQFDENGGGTAIDSRSSSPENGTLVNSPIWLPLPDDSATLAGLNPGTVYHVRSVSENTNGVIASFPEQLATPAPGRGTALEFDGVNDYVRISDLDSDAPLTEVTVEFWQRIHAQKAQSVFSLEPDVTANRLQAHTPWANGTVYWDFGNISGNGRLTYVPPESLLDEWNHFALVASQTGGYMHIYRNGVLEAQKGSMDPREIGNFDLILGRYTLSGTSYYLDGEIDDIRVWNQARNQDEIRNNMNVVLPNNTPGMVAYLRLDEGGGQSVHDSAGLLTISEGLLVGRPNWVASEAPVGLPLAVTLAATGIGLGNATVNGTVNGEGSEAAAYWFEYGEGANLNLVTPTQFFPASTNIDNATVTLTNLLGGKIYSFRLIAANSNGTNYGDVLNFYMPFPASGFALQFDGTNYVNLGSSTALKATTALTIEAWIYPTGPGQSPTTGGIIVNKEGEYEIARFPDGTLRWALAISSPAWTWINMGIVAPSNEWMHVAFTYDKAKVRLYTNGVFATQYTATGNIGDVNTSLNELWVGQRQAGGQGFHGAIDEVRVWNVTRSASDILANYNRLLAGSESGLLAYLHFDEGAGTTTYDSAANHFSGTLVNSPTFVLSGALPSSPLVTTLTPSPVQAVNATLRGSINPAGQSVNTYFEYGPTIAYGASTLTENYPESLSPVEISAQLTGLDPGTTYHYRAVGYNTSRTNYGADQTFTTLVLGSGWPVSTKLTGGEAFSPLHTLDNAGNAYVAGIFSGSASFRSPLEPEGATANAFVGKMSEMADWTWATNVPSSSNGFTQIKAIATDTDRNVYVAGQFSGTNNFGATELVADGITNLFVAKLDSGGTNWLWANAVGSAGLNSANAITLVGSNVFVAGQFTGSADFTVTNLVSGGLSDVFVAALDANGSWLWARAGSGTGDAAANTIAFDSITNLYVAGQYAGSITFGGTTLTNAGGTDIFVAKLTASGTPVIARRGGGVNNDVANSLAAVSGNQFYLVGQFGSTADYAGTVNNLNVGNSSNIFVLKLSSEAQYIDYTQGGSGEARSVAVDSQERVYVLGDFTFSTLLGTNSLISAGNRDVFIAQLIGGDWTWAQRIGSAGNETAGTVSVDANGSVVLSGTYQGTIQIGFVALSSLNNRDIFIARIDANKVFEHNRFEVGKAIAVPLDAQDPFYGDGAIGQPTITILEKDQADSDALNSFVWSIAEHKLYPIRQVTAILKWPLTTNPTNTAAVVTAVGRSRYPTNPIIHVANAPANLEPGVPNFPLKFLNLAFTTINGANVDASSKQFNAGATGWSVVQFLDTDGALPDPLTHPSKFEVVRTILWNDPQYLPSDEPAVIGTALTRLSHDDPEGRNGFVYFESSFYDGAGDERAYNRLTRTGPIIPVNKDTASTIDDLVVVWYSVSANGIGWPSQPVRYLANWPAAPDELVLSDGLGSGQLLATDFPSKRVYNQPDKLLPGFNPNEEHAALYGDTLYALRNDLNNVISPKASEPYALLKYVEPSSGDWAMRVFKVVTTNTSSPLAYSAVAGQPLLLPPPLNLLALCNLSNRVVSGPGFQDYAGRLYARAAGPANSGTNILARYWYPLQPGFFYDLNLDGTPDAPTGTCVPWLDRRVGGIAGTPVDVRYNVTWPTLVPTLQIGESLINAHDSLPDLLNFASAAVVFDQGNPADTNALNSLVRLYDPLSARTLQLPEEFELPGSIQKGFDVGKIVFPDLPYALRIRLAYDELNRQLSFNGVLDESTEYGGPANPLLLNNVLSPRESERIKELVADETDAVAKQAFVDAIDDLYDLSRNPNQLDADGNGEPDQTLLIGLDYVIKTNLSSGVITTNIGPEQLGDIPKVLTAGPGTGSGYVTVIENNDASLSGFPVTMHVIRVEGGPVRGDLKVLYSDNVFDQKLTLRHSADFGGEPQRFEFQWYYVPDDPNLNHTNFPVVNAAGTVIDQGDWITYPGVPGGTNGFNDITIGEGGVSGLLALADNWFICRYRGYAVNGQTNWSDWVGEIGGGRARFADGWVKRVIEGLNPFDQRTDNFHDNAAATFASMLQQAGTRYEGDIAFNPSAGNLNSIGLIEAYETVLRRAEQLSINASPGINYSPANNALLLAASRINDFYMLLGNEAYADAADPTIGFRTDQAGYGTLAPSIFTFQNQLDSLLEEELVLLRGRDDRSATVRSAPVYNRLFWNFTQNEGEVAYAQAYNITDQNTDGFIDADDASIMFPQGHGDAWGHYLTGIKRYYALLQNTNFDWIPRSEFVSLAGVAVEVDYLDERKFARAAAARAKTGAEIVDLTYRINYVDDPAGQFQGYKDTDTSRAWGLSEWGHRTGSGAFFDWVTANAILPATDPNTNHTGIQKIDRTTVRELDEIISGFESVQQQLDKADEGLNPLGLAKGVVPFDIDPSLIDAGETHFEQIYDRALSALNNTLTVFNHANQLSQSLRALQDTVNDFSRNVDEQERDYKNRLFEIFGYPYAGDIGTGKTYPSGYDGPDIYHYMYINTLGLNGDTAPPAPDFTGYFTSLENNFPFFEDDLPALINPSLDPIFTVTYPRSTADYAFVAPASWGERQAPGEIQLALSEMIQSEARVKQAALAYDNLLKQIDDQVDLLEARYDLRSSTVTIRDNLTAENKRLSAWINGYKVVKLGSTSAKNSIKEASEIVLESIPKVVGVATDATAPVRGTIKAASGALTKLLSVAAFGAEVAINLAEASKEANKNEAQIQIDTANYEYEVRQQLKALEALIREESVSRAELFTLQEKVNQNVGRYQAALAKGLRLIEERTAFRRNAAADTQVSRYQDMTFRIFRNDAIQKYRAQFDLAAQYVFLAATAYDFETQLLGGQTGSGQQFLTDIIRQRGVGQIENGVPIAGRHGIADPLARLGQNFGVLKGQLGFNNPQTETGRFSLRNELFRLKDSSAENWQAELKRNVVPNLWDVPEFRRYCRPFAPESAGPQPGLVIRFSTTITFGLNYFRWPLGGGDNSYDSTLFATKVRSAGVWFEDYNGSGLSQTPRIYLVPVGADVMRSPSGNNLETREWRVVDQKIPVPFPIGFSSLNDETWIPMNDSLSDQFAEIRRFSSFRAYHDSGVFNEAEMINDSRLIGRSVWNTDWMLIIPGGTFLFDPNQGLDTFIDSVGDIKIFFQTYAYSGD